MWSAGKAHARTARTAKLTELSRQPPGYLAESGKIPPTHCAGCMRWEVAFSCVRCHQGLCGTECEQTHAARCPARPSAPLRRKAKDSVFSHKVNDARRPDLRRGLLMNNKTGKIHAIAENPEGPSVIDPWVSVATSGLAPQDVPGRVSSLHGRELRTVCGFRPRASEVTMVPLDAVHTQGRQVCDKCLPSRRLSAAGLRIAPGGFRLHQAPVPRRPRRRGRGRARRLGHLRRLVALIV